MIGANLDHPFSSTLEYLFAGLANVFCYVEHKVMVQLKRDDISTL